MANNYMGWINQSVEATRDYLQKNELDHYVADNGDINGNKAEADKLTGKQVYDISSYSTLITVQKSLKELKDTGAARPIKLGEDEGDGVIIVGKIDAETKGDLRKALEQIIKELGDK